MRVKEEMMSCFMLSNAHHKGRENLDVILSVGCLKCINNKNKRSEETMLLNEFKPSNISIFEKCKQ